MRDLVCFGFHRAEVGLFSGMKTGACLAGEEATDRMAER